MNARTNTQQSVTQDENITTVFISCFNANKKVIVTDNDKQEMKSVDQMSKTQRMIPWSTSATSTILLKEQVCLS